RFPAVWIPDGDTRDRRALVAHRVRLVRMRTMVKNGLQAIALSQRLALRSKLWTRQDLAQLQALPLPAHTARRREDSLQLLAWLPARIDQLDEQIATIASHDPRAQLLLTHPGIGPLTALTTVLILGPIARFPDSKHVASYVGLAPAVAASADKQRLARSPSRAARSSAGCSAKPRPSRPEPMRICAPPNSRPRARPALSS